MVGTSLSGVSLFAAAVVLSWPGFVLGLYQGQEQGHCSMRFNQLLVFLHPLQRQLLVFLHSLHWQALGVSAPSATAALGKHMYVPVLLKLQKANCNCRQRDCTGYVCVQVRGKGLLNAIVIKEQGNVNAYDVCLKLKDAGLLVSCLPT